MVQHGQFPDTYYRVSLKAVIRNDKDEVLCVKEHSEAWALPGGGMDHGEDVRNALSRELKEEIGYSGEFTYKPIGVITLYDDPNDRCMMLIGFNVTLKNEYIASLGSDAHEVAWMDPRTFKNIDQRGSRAIYHFAIDQNSSIDFIRKN